jgi:carbon-monoxide dehydrogenase medium subunit
MIPAAVDYVRVDSVEAAIAALAEVGDEAKLLAGGQSLVPLMRLRLATPSVLVDIGRLDDLTGISVDGDTVVIGALTTHSTLEHSADLVAACPLLAHVASQVGDPAVRHRGTLGGGQIPI